MFYNPSLSSSSSSTLHLWQFAGKQRERIADVGLYTIRTRDDCCLWRIVKKLSSSDLWECLAQIVLYIFCSDHMLVFVKLIHKKTDSNQFKIVLKRKKYSFPKSSEKTILFFVFFLVLLVYRYTTPSSIEYTFIIMRECYRSIVTLLLFIEWMNQQSSRILVTLNWLLLFFKMYTMYLLLFYFCRWK